MCELTGIGLSIWINEFKVHPELQAYHVQEYILISYDVTFLKVIIMMSDTEYIFLLLLFSHGVFLKQSSFL